MTSNNIYTDFKPTYLYIKQHSITGKLYFGKTEGRFKSVESYHGSGKRWLRHIKKHGLKYVTTLWYCLFLDKESIEEFALNFSKQENIVESEQWLNLKPENGLDGGTYTKWTEEQKESIRGENNHGYGKPGPRLGVKETSETKLKKRNSHLGLKHSQECKDKIRAALRGKPKDKIACPHCTKTGQASNMKRWHFDNCKSK